MRTIDDIIPPSRRKETEPVNSNNSTNRSNSRSGKLRSYRTIFFLLAIIAIAVGGLYYFSSAKVEITPNTVSVAVQNSFTATQSKGDLPYEIISTQKIASQSVTGNGTKTVSTSASGNITLYNTQTKSQKLITNTRFATTAGLIFRIHTSITIPAGTTEKPGSANTKVYADAPGDSYNVGPTSFTIPGFAGTPQESEVYARSTNPMSGGMSGTIPVVDAATESSTKDSLMGALTPQLMASLQNQVPAGYILLPGAATTTFEELTPATASTTGMVDIKEQGTATAIIFPNTALAKAIAQSVTALNYQGEPLSLLPTSKLQISIAQPLVDAASTSFLISGTASLVYNIDTTRIAATIAGKTRSEAEVALTNFPEVKRALIILRPFWNQTFPADPSQITVSTLAP